MKDGAAAPTRLVSIKAIPDLGGIKDLGAQGIRIGALVTIDEFMNHPVVKANYPALIQAADGIRSPQIQSVGTVVGDLCQRPRCWYFRTGFGLLAMKDGKSMVPEGDNRYHAILGNSGPAYFVSPSILAPALIALGAKLSIQGASGSRQVAVADFFKVPASEGELEHDLAAKEIVTEIVIPPAAGKKSASYEVRQKEALDWPLTAAAVALEMDGNTVKAAKVVLGHVAPKPWVADAAASALVGKAVSEATATAAGEAAVQGAKALSKNAYKIALAQVTVKRAVLRAAGMEVA
jgi:xanthine dehydrogenase YagS FAD-binding subunit